MDQTWPVPEECPHSADQAQASCLSSLTVNNTYQPIANCSDVLHGTSTLSLLERCEGSGLGAAHQRIVPWHSVQIWVFPVAFIWSELSGLETTKTMWVQRPTSLSFSSLNLFESSTGFRCKASEWPVMCDFFCACSFSLRQHSDHFWILQGHSDVLTHDRVATSAWAIAWLWVSVEGISLLINVLELAGI